MGISLPAGESPRARLDVDKDNPSLVEYALLIGLISANPRIAIVGRTGTPTAGANIGMLGFGHGQQQGQATLNIGTIGIATDALFENTGVSGIVTNSAQATPLNFGVRGVAGGSNSFVGSILTNFQTLNSGSINHYGVQGIANGDPATTNNYGGWFGVSANTNTTTKINTALYATSNTSALPGTAPDPANTSYAGYFDGNVKVNGKFSADTMNIPVIMTNRIISTDSIIHFGESSIVWNTCQDRIFNNGVKVSGYLGCNTITFYILVQYIVLS